MTFFYFPLQSYTKAAEFDWWQTVHPLFDLKRRQGSLIGLSILYYLIVVVVRL